MEKLEQNSLDYDLWAEAYGEKLLPEDTYQIYQNVTGFFNLLKDWSEDDKKA